MGSEFKPFKVDIPQVEVDRLYQKIKDTRYPTEDIVPEAGQDYGMSTKWALRLIKYWQTEYSWPAAQTKLNSFSHFTSTIDGTTIHFLHERSPHPNAKPILLLHGWPGSFHEFHRLIPLLTNPSDPTTTQPFHCIVPSLPGFIFSPAPPTRAWTVKHTARALHTLLTSPTHLNYTTGYAIQAGDWGQFVARELGAQYTSPTGCKVLHLNYCPGTLPSPPETPREQACQDKGQAWRMQHIGYASLMRTRPQTLAFMLTDNPIGLLAFVGEKYDEAANPRMQSRPSWMDDVLTTVCLYYFTRCIGSSGLIYYENVWHEQFAAWAEEKPENFVVCPFAYSSYWFDTAPNSRRAVERTGRLVLYRERDYAGHFAALEDPEGVAEDVREVVEGFWGQ